MEAMGFQVERPELSDALTDAMELFELMGRRVDLAALPVLCDLYRVPLDDELLWRLGLLSGMLG